MPPYSWFAAVVSSMVAFAPANSIAQAVNGLPAHVRKVRPLIIIVGMEKCCVAEAWPEAEAAAEAELTAMGLDVRMVPGVADGERERRLEIEKIARMSSASCAVRIVRSSDSIGGVELWVNDRVTGKVTYRLIEAGVKGSVASPDLMALKIVEAMRASFMELRLPDRVGLRPPPPPPPEIEAMVTELPLAPSSSSIRVFLASGVLFGPGDAGPFGSLESGLRWTPREKLALDAVVATTFVGREVEHDGSSATVDLATLRLAAFFVPVHDRPLSPDAGFGAGLVYLWAGGKNMDESEGKVPLDARALGVWLGADAGFTAAVGSHLSLRFFGRFGAIFPKTTISFAREKVADVGRPLLEGGLRFQVKLP